MTTNEETRRPEQSPRPVPMRRTTSGQLSDLAGAPPKPRPRNLPVLVLVDLEAKTVESLVMTRRPPRRVASPLPRARLHERRAARLHNNDAVPPHTETKITAPMSTPKRITTTTTTTTTTTLTTTMPPRMAFVRRPVAHRAGGALGLPLLLEDAQSCEECSAN